MVYYFQCNPDQCHLYFNICYIRSNPVYQIKQAEKLKSRKMKDKGGWVFADRQIDIGDYYLVFYSTSTNDHICP